MFVVRHCPRIQRDENLTLDMGEPVFEGETDIEKVSRKREKEEKKRM